MHPDAMERREAAWGPPSNSSHIMREERENADEHNRIKAATNFYAVWMLIAYVSITGCILEYAPCFPPNCTRPLHPPRRSLRGCSCDQSRGLEIPMAPAKFPLKLIIPPTVPFVYLFARILAELEGDGPPRHAKIEFPSCGVANAISMRRFIHSSRLKVSAAV